MAEDVILRPLPRFVTPESRPFWEGLRNRRLMLPNCAQCGPFFYPRVFCPRCHRRVSEWTESKGRGRLHAFQIAYQQFNPEFRISPPYVLALVRLDEGPRILTGLVGIDPDPDLIRCEMLVEAVFERLNDEFTVVLFRPAA